MLSCFPIDDGDSDGDGDDEEVEEDEEEDFDCCLATFWFGTFVMLLTPRGMLLVMKTLEDEWYHDIEANLFTHFCTIHSYRDSMTPQYTTVC